MAEQIAQAQTLVSTGKRPVEMPKSRAGRDVQMIKGPSALTTVTATPPHTSTIPRRQEKPLGGPVSAFPRKV